MKLSFGMTNLSNEGVDGVMGEDEVVASVVIEEVISLWAQAESGPGSKAKSKISKAKSTAADASAGLRADGSVPFTLASIEGMTPKELGELAEAEFLRRALGMGVGVAKAWGGSGACYFILGVRGRGGWGRGYGGVPEGAEGGAGGLGGRGVVK